MLGQRWLSVFFFLLVAAVVWPLRASAASATDTQTRVWEIDLAAHALVGSQYARSTENHEAKSIAEYTLASDSPFAAEAAPALRFSQTTASSAFSAEGTFAGNTIGGLASDLRAGAVAAGDVPVSYVNLGGNSLIVNTRSSLALTRAGIPQSKWTLIDATATDAASIQARLIRNGLTVEGTPTLRITGLGRGASSLE